MTLRCTGAALLAAGSLAAAAAALTARACGFPAARQSPRAEVLRAIGALRPVPGRISGLAYASYPTTLPPVLALDRRRALIAAERRIEREETGPHGAIARADLALVRLAGGKVAAAVRELEAAAGLAPRDGRLQSDLCALRLEQARRGSPEAHLDALVAAQAAVDLAPRLLPAYFNLSLSLELNGLREQAAEAWADYLRRDSDSPWAAEARRHLALVEAPDDARLWEGLRGGVAAAVAHGDTARLLTLCHRFPREMQQLAEESLLDRWSKAYTAGDSRTAAAALATARTVGRSLAAAGGDWLIYDAVGVLDRWASAPAPGADHLLRQARALRDLASGEQLCLNQGAGGPGRLELARTALSEAGNPLEKRALYDLAVCSYEHARYDEALPRLQSLFANHDTGRYPRLAGNASLMRGMCYLASGQPGLSLRAYEAANRIFLDSGAVNEAGHAAYLLSENLRYLGERRAALRLLLDAAAAAVKSGEPRALYRVYDGLAEEATRRGASKAALDFRDEVLRVARRAAERSQLQEAGLAHAWLRRGEARLGVGDAGGAREDLLCAARYVERIPDRDARRLREADLLLAQGRVLLATDPRRALRHLSGAVEEKLEQQSLFFLLEALHTRARAELALGDRAAAASDLEKALRQFEQQRAEVVSLALRASYLDRVGELFDLAITLAADAPGGSAAALELAERERARSLLDLIGPPDAGMVRAAGGPASTGAGDGTHAPLAVSSLLERLPDGVAVVEFAALPDRLLAWLLRRGSAATLIESRIGAHEVAALADRFRQALEARDPQAESERLGAALSGALLVRILGLVPEGEELVFIPDRVLRDLPFGALRDPRTHRYLVEEHPVAVAPSATLFIEGIERDRAGSRRQALNALVVGDPRFDRHLYPDLAELPSSAAEAAAVAAVYGAAADLRLGQEATGYALLEGAGHYAVVHVAAHALTDPEFPSLSRLVLAPARGTDGSLYAHEIGRRHFRDTRLVVLAACNSGLGSTEIREGAQGLAWAFLAAGVPAVVASLWSIDDLDTGSLLAEFHRRFLVSRDAPAALRAAQLALLRGPDPGLRSPAVWASFELLGGLAATVPRG